jgi:hypothetical protein
MQVLAYALWLVNKAIAIDLRFPARVIVDRSQAERPTAPPLSQR